MNEGLLNGGVDWAFIGAKLAHADADEQAAFLATFLRECRAWGTAYQVEKQLAAVNDALSAEDRRALAMLSYEESRP